MDIEDDIECAEDYTNKWLDDKSFEIRGVEVIGKVDAKELSDWLIEQLKDMAKMLDDSENFDTAQDAERKSYLKLKDLVELRELYGEHAELRHVIRHEAGTDVLYECPECKGSGVVKEEHWRDTGEWLHGGVFPEAKYEKYEEWVSCKFCGGHGYVTKKYKPKMVKKEYTEQEGWEVDE